MFVFVVRHVALLAALVLAIAGAGTLILGKRESVALRCATGLAAWGHALFALAIVGLLRPEPILLLALICAVAIALPLERRAPRPPSALPADEGARRSNLPLLAAVLFAAMFVIALRPPLAFDETLYHLPYIDALVSTGRLGFLPDARFPVFPEFHELLCAPMMLAGGDTAAHLVSLVEIAIAAALLAQHNRVGAALFLGSPIVVYLGTIAYVEAALVLFVTAGFHCLDRRRFALAGFFLGTACSVKYLGGFFALAALIIVVFTNRKAVLTFLGRCVAAALPMTLWIAIKTGDPLFPFLRPSIWALVPAQPSLTERLQRTVRLAWDVSFARAEVNQEPPFTPFFIVMLIMLAIAPRRDVRARWVAGIVVVYVAFFSFLPQDSRYLVPLLPLIGAFILVRNRFDEAIAIAPGIAYAIYFLAVHGLPPATPAAREAMLRASVREYAALERAGSHTVYVCGAEQLKGLAQGRLLGDFAGQYAYNRVVARNTSAIAANLRRIDATDYLVAKKRCSPPIDDGGLRLMYEDTAAQLWRLQESNPQVR